MNNLKSILRYFIRTYLVTLIKNQKHAGSKLHGLKVKP